MTAEGEVRTLYTGEDDIAGMVEDSQGRIVFCMRDSHCIGMLAKDGTATILAGQPGSATITVGVNSIQERRDLWMDHRIKLSFMVHGDLQ